MPTAAAAGARPVFGALVAAALLAVVPSARSQGSAAAAAADERAVSDRVRREASNPMRIILEASRIKRRVGEGEDTAAPVTAPAAAAVRPVRPPESAPQLASLNPPRPQSRSFESVTPALAASGAAAVATLPPLELPALRSVPSLASPAAPSRTITSPGPSPGSGAAAGLNAPAADLSPTPRLLSQVTPELPTQLQRRLGTLPDVTVEVTIERDGSVSRAALIGGVSRAAEPYIVEALRQWRFAPLPQPVTQRLTLVFN